MRVAVRISYPTLVAIALTLSLGIASATAQINPFRYSQTGEPVRQEDLAALFKSADKLNTMPSVKPGATDSWSNPASGVRGTSTLTLIRKVGSMTCHVIHHEIYTKKSVTPAVYNVTWCPDAAGDWKIHK